MNAPHSLSIDSGGDQFPVCGPAPRLSWKPASDGPLPAAWELQAYVDGKECPTATAEHCTLLEWPWPSLKSRERVTWRVRGSGGSVWSEWHYFEAGLLDSDWKASWISPVEASPSVGEHRPAHVLATSFEVPDDVTSARLYSTALGIYTASVNGARVGTIELAPGSTSYDETLYAQATDVTELLSQGSNRFEVDLADGWYRGYVGAFRVPATWGTTLGFRSELHLELASGEHQVICSGEGWSSRRSTSVRADLMDGQTSDFTAASEPESPALVDVVDAPPISWSPAPPVRVVETRPAERVAAIRSGVWVMDFGQNASGWVRMRDLGSLGTKTTIEYGEFLDGDGDLSTSHLDSSRPDGQTKTFTQQDEVISDGTEEEFEPRMTVHGFQYIRVTREGADFDPASVDMQIVHTDLARTGTFSCSNEDLNQLHAMADWSFRGNAVDVPTDCPTRERLGWTGDYQIFAPTATRLYDVLGFTRKWLQSVRDDQLEDGRIANFSPDGRRIKHHLDDQFAMMTGSAGWGDAVVSVPWEMYLSYGDEEILRENWTAMRRWLDWVVDTARTKRHPSRLQRSAEPAVHEEFLWDGSFHWGEWIEPKEKDSEGNPIDPVKTDPAGWFMADKGEVGTAFLYRSADTLARIAAILARVDEAEKYSQIASKTREAWQIEYLAEDGRTRGDSQASYVRALSFGLIPETLREASTERLLELVAREDMHLSTGFLATGDLLPVLADAGRSDVAYQLLLQRTAPSWLYMVDGGATTIWEEWEGIDDEGAAHESLNHYSKGAVVRFLHSHVLGLRQEAASHSWQSVVISPLIGGGISWAEGTHESPQGEIHVRWQIVDSELELFAHLPAKTRARVVFPDGSEDAVGPGVHTWKKTLQNTLAIG